MDHIWNQQHEKILKSWAEISSCYSWMHDRAYREYKIKNMYYAIPVIILSTLTGTANFAQQSIPEGYRPTAVMVIGGLNLLSGLITTLAQFFKVNELQEAHRIASVVFSKFSRNISVELNLPIKDRASDGATFLEHCRQEYNRLLEQSPIIPTNVLVKFNRKFKKSHFSKPIITKLKEIEIYHDEEYIAIKEEKIQEEKIEKEEKARLIEHEKTMKNLENIKSQMSFRLPELLKSESQKLDDLDMSSDISNDVDSSSTESNKSPNVKNTNIENTNVENTVNIEMVASETAEKAIYDAKNALDIV